MANRFGAPLCWSEARDDTSTSALCYLGAAVALGFAIQQANGSWSPLAIPLLAAALLLTAFGVARIPVAAVDRHQRWILPVAFALALGFQLAVLQSSWPASYLRPPPGHGLVPLSRLLVLIALTCGAALLARREDRLAKHVQVAAIVGLHFAAGVWIIEHAPAPWVDVDYFHRSAVKALLAGESPYSQTIPNIYGHTEFYGEGLVKDGRVQAGFPYPPLSLLFSLPSALLTGDHRYSGLVAMAGAAVLMSYARPGTTGVLAAAVFLLTPRTFFILEHGWTEPFAVLLLALTAFAAVRFAAWLPWTVAALMSIKQYMLLGTVALLLAVPREDFAQRVRRIAAIAIAFGLACALPFLFWDPRGFVNDVLLIQLVQPFRTDALSFLADYARRTGVRPSPAWAIVPVLGAQALILWRAPRTAAGMCGGFALTFGLFFAFNKQAFANYYALVIGALCCAVAVTSSSSDGASSSQPAAATPPQPA